MNRRTNLALVLGLWILPLAIGIVIASRFIATGPARVPVAVREPDAAGPGDEAPEVASDQRRIQGSWRCALLERDGKTVYDGDEAAAARVVFEADTVTFEDSEATLRGTFRLDPEARPKGFDLIVTEEGRPVEYPAGIYQLDDDILRLCFGFPSRVRPTSFTTTPGSGRTLFVYRRAPPERRGVRSTIRSYLTLLAERRRD